MNVDNSSTMAPLVGESGGGASKPADRHLSRSPFSAFAVNAMMGDGVPDGLTGSGALLQGL